MIKISICDDDIQFISLLKSEIHKQLENYSFSSDTLFSIGPCFDNGRDLLKHLEKHIINVLFLDIRLPNMNGFEIAKEIRRDRKEILLIFTTAYNEYVFDSFEYSPFAFLRKDHIHEDLPKLLKRIYERLTDSREATYLSIFSKTIMINVCEVLYFESQKNYFVAHMKDGNECIRRGTISMLEDNLSEHGFLRTHSSFLVNLEYAEKIIESRYLYVGGQMVPIAQKRLSGVKAALAMHSFKA